MISNSLKSDNKIPIDSALEMILQQRSFFPILPNTVNNEENDRMDRIINVDYRKLEYMYMSAIPDIIITSSAMNPFVKKINSTLFINPGSLIKGSNLGAFAKIISFPPSVIYLY